MIFRVDSALALLLPGSFVVGFLIRLLDSRLAERPETLAVLERVGLLEPGADWRGAHIELHPQLSPTKTAILRCGSFFFPGCRVSVEESLERPFYLGVEVEPSPAFRLAALIAPRLTRLVALCRLAAMRRALDSTTGTPYLRVTYHLVGFPDVGRSPTKVS